MTNRFMDYSTYRAPKTNADRIRAMSDEELAEFIVELNEICLAGIGCIDCSDRNCVDCKHIVRQWLKSEAKE